MDYKMFLFLCASCFFVTETLAECKAPKQTIDLETYKLSDFAGTWYTQAINAPFEDPHKLPVCLKIVYSTVSCGAECINETLLEGRSEASWTCQQGPCQEYANLIHNKENGTISFEALKNENGPVYVQIPCHIISGKPGKYMTMSCCRTFSAHFHMDVVYYLTSSSKTKPDLTYQMHSDMKKAGLKHLSKGLIITSPETCMPFKAVYPDQWKCTLA